ncbi:type II toxin-antitoxin system VapC family toxin [Knoellia sinensis]|uniref:type II toxin-antitoxin system VapC family toxin n=1 Tax=Knoellia sinensis TaxID=136100 RepID=UPI000AFCF770|nr:type II toxin-antitoxin system VapC family toxin [Knoellia sinensis]
MDTTVFLLASGDEHPARVDATDFLARARDGAQGLHVSVEALQEFTFHRLRRVERAQALDQSEALARAVVVHPFDAEIMARSVALMRVTSLRGRDAVHAATALAAGFDQIVTTDRDFEGVPGLRRIDPRDAKVS